MSPKGGSLSDVTFSPATFPTNFLLTNANHSATIPNRKNRILPWSAPGISGRFAFQPPEKCIP
jgi:hypothetical protein